MAYTKNLSGGNPLSELMVDTSEIKDVNIDGSDFTLFFRLFGMGVNGMLMLSSLALIAILIIAEVFFVIIPVLLLRFIGLKKSLTDTVNVDEYRIVKYIYISAIGLSVILGLIASGFVAIIPMLCLDAAWILIVLIYVLGLKSRIKDRELIEARMMAEQFK